MSRAVEACFSFRYSFLKGNHEKQLVVVRFPSRGTLFAYSLSMIVENGVERQFGRYVSQELRVFGQSTWA